MTDIEAKINDLGFNERRCADPDCCKVFLITGPLKLYVFKIEYGPRYLDYFCCYSHYKKRMEQVDKEKASNRKAYIQRKKARSANC